MRSLYEKARRHLEQQSAATQEQSGEGMPWALDELLGKGSPQRASPSAESDTGELVLLTSEYTNRSNIGRQRREAARPHSRKHKASTPLLAKTRSEPAPRLIRNTFRAHDARLHHLVLRRQCLLPSSRRRFRSLRIRMEPSSAPRACSLGRGAW
jgi:hypothetical protein